MSDAPKGKGKRHRITKETASATAKRGKGRGAITQIDRAQVVELAAQGKSAGDIAHTLGRNREHISKLVHHELRAEIAAAAERRLAKERINTDRVIEELARVGFSDVRRLFDENGAILPIQAWPADVAAAIASVEFEGGEVSKVRLWPKTQALEQLGRALGLFAKTDAAVAAAGAPRLAVSFEQVIQVIAQAGGVTGKHG